MNLKSYQVEKFKKWKNQLHNSAGFTLIEMFSVLLIWSLLIGLLVHLSPSLFQSQQEKAFMKQFKTDVLWAQQQTMTRQHRLSLLLVPEDHEYQILKDRTNMLVKRPIPNHWDISLNYTLDRHIRFDVNGSIVQAGSIQFQTPSKNLKVVFPLGKARFYVLER